MKRVYIAHALKGDWFAGIRETKVWAFEAAKRGFMPVAPHVLFDGILDDSDPDERDRGMRLGLAQLAECDEIWLCGERVSEGMEGERVFAESRGIHVRRFEWPSEIPGGLRG
jgi:hypothetical protein